MIVYSLFIFLCTNLSFCVPNHKNTKPQKHQITKSPNHSNSTNLLFHSA